MHCTSSENGIYVVFCRFAASFGRLPSRGFNRTCGVALNIPYDFCGIIADFEFGHYDVAVAVIVDRQRITGVVIELAHDGEDRRTGLVSVSGIRISSSQIDVRIVNRLGGNVIVNVKETRVAISEEMAQKIMI